MKLRTLGDSIRLRLTQSEVSALAAEGMVEAKTRVGPEALVYRVAAADVAAPQARLVGGELTVELPREAVAQWAGSEQVGIEAQQELVEGSLRILVEKDFKCLAPRDDEDQSDAYAHPNADTQSC